MIHITDINYEKGELYFDYQDKSFHIPSDYFPIEGNEMLLYSDVTSTLKNRKIQDIFDRQNPILGQCYQNTQNLYNDLVSNGISRHHLKIVSGWLTTHLELFVHHCCLVYKDKYVLDLTARLDLDEKRLIGKKSEEIETIIKGTLKRMEHMPPSKKAIFGKMRSYDFFIGGVVNSCDEAHQMYKDLLKKYPDHITYANVVEKGNPFWNK